MPNIDDLIGRRNATRHEVSLAGSLLTAGRHQNVLIQDLSANGAKLCLSRQIPEGPAILSIEDRKVTGEVLWADGLFAGFKFDQELADLASAPPSDGKGDCDG